MSPDGLDRFLGLGVLLATSSDSVMFLFVVRRVRTLVYVRKKIETIANVAEWVGVKMRV
jgi:hypothetical protein